jgi:hypothetical protein
MLGNSYMLEGKIYIVKVINNSVVEYGLQNVNISNNIV